MVGEKGWKFVAKKEKTVERVLKSLKVQKTSVFSFANMAEYYQSRENFNRCEGPFLLNEDGDLCFFFIR